MHPETGNGVEARRIQRVLRQHGRLVLKAFAVFASAVLVTVSLSQLVDMEPKTISEAAALLAIGSGFIASGAALWDMTH